MNPMGSAWGIGFTIVDARRKKLPKGRGVPHVPHRIPALVPSLQVFC
jgi:hypothetical protein